MNVAVRRTMTLADFLAWEERQPFKHEFDGFNPVAMTGVRVAHAAIQTNVLSLLNVQLRGKPCRPFGSDLKIAAGSSVRYPDVFVVCRHLANDETLVTDPVVVFEILSQGTAHTDLVLKNEEYRLTPSILRYVVLEQTHIGAIAFGREGGWQGRSFRAGDTIDLPEIGATLPMADIYDGLTLQPDEN